MASTKQNISTGKNKNSQNEETPVIVVDNGAPVKVEGGQAIINKKATEKHHERLSEINESVGGNPIPDPKEVGDDPQSVDTPVTKTTDAREGGLFTGDSHAEGGIPAIVTDTGQKIEVEGREAILSREATIKFWKELSAINQSAGNGVPIPPPSKTEAVHEAFESGGKLTETDQKRIYKKWTKLLNMTSPQLRHYRSTKDYRTAGLTRQEAKDLGISSGKESFAWILKMKATPVDKWTSEMWHWAKKQINFVSRMKGVKGRLRDDSGNRTPKLKALMLWGHNPETFEVGGKIEAMSKEDIEYLAEKYNITTKRKGKKKDVSTKELSEEEIKELAKKFNVKPASEEFSEGGTPHTLLAPNGQPSNLTPEQYQLVRTPEFKAWFGDWENDPKNASKVVDENGEPLVVYHGSKNRFTTFSKDHQGSNTDKSGELGFFFTANRSIANEFKSETGKIYYCFLNLRNPETLSGKRFTLINDYKNFQNILRESEYDGVKVEPFNSEQMEQWISMFGEDGSSEYTEIQYVAFSPTQIKLADGSNTTFDPQNPDIRFEEGGTTERRVPADLDTDLEINFGDKLKSTGEIIVAHSTSSNLLPKILKEGLRRNSINAWQDTTKGKLYFEIEPSYTYYGDNVYGWKATQVFGGVPITLYVKVKQDQLSVDRDDSVLGRAYVKNQRECLCDIPPENILGLSFVRRITIAPKDFMEFYEMFKEENNLYKQGGSTPLPAIETIKKEIEPYMENMVDRFIEYKKSKDEPYTQLDIYFYRLNLQLDLLKALGSYLLPTDTVTDLKISSNSEVIVINCSIHRDDNTFQFRTEVIIAGGYNIQVAHYRYLVKTPLRKLTSNPSFDKLNERIKKLSKAQRSVEFINEQQRRIEYNINRIETFSKMSDDELLAHSKSNKKGWEADHITRLSLTWEQAQEVYNPEFLARGKDAYYAYVSEAKENEINFQKRINIESPKRAIEDYKKNIRKEFKKLDAMDADEIVLAQLKVSPDQYAEGGLVLFDEEVLLAPNGQITNLNPEQYHLVRTNEFKAWFGDWENDPENASKVVDENGEPLVVYHGTKNDFSIFDLEKVGSKTDTGMWGKGFYFSSSRDYAQTYADKPFDYATSKVLPEKGIVLSVFLCLKNPYFIRNNQDIPKVDTPNETLDDMLNADSTYSKKLREKLISDGYDGVFVKFEFNFRGSRDFELVAFEPNQIKFADGSNTTFDSQNPDIRFEAGCRTDFLLAPNGKPTNLTPEQYHLVRTNEFKAWFGDWENDPENASKVVDENGEPKVMYHGARAKFTIFSDVNENKLSWTEGGKGFYFTSLYNNAFAYGENVLACFIKANPIMSDGKQHAFVTEYDLNKIKSWGSDAIYFDGEILNTEGRWVMTADELVVFESNQIKLADGSNTTFDSQNPDIRFEAGGRTDFLLAPNGKPTNLTPEQYHLVRTKEFKAWFGDWENDPENASKVIDENGEPLVVYHGTNQDNKFYVFDSKKGKSYGGFNGFGHWFTDSEKYAKAYSITDYIQKSLGIVLECFLNIREPWLLHGNKGFNELEGRYKFKTGAENAYRATHEENILFKQYLKSSNKDGVFISQFAGDPGLMEYFDADLYQNVYVALDSTQIKLADGSNTTFDSQNPDIRFESGGKTDVLSAPNGKPTNLTPEQYHLVRTNEFKAWFGDWENDPENASKVVDINGEPLVVYHGTNTNFTIFKPSESIGTHGEKDQLKGIYFTDNRESANWYALKEDDPRFLKSCFLNIKNPLTAQTNAELKAKSDSSIFAEISDFAKESGYDGIMVEEGFYTLGLSKLYLCFKSNQIKLADGSNTTFDSQNPDIRFEEGGTTTLNLPQQTELNLFEGGGSVIDMEQPATTEPTVNDPTDKIVVDVPFFIRALEHAREDIKSDADLHRFVDNMIAIRNKGVITMKDYDTVSIKDSAPETAPEFSEGGFIDAKKQTTHAKRINENMQRMNSDLSEWTSVEIKSHASVTDKNGNAKIVPNYILPENYRPAPTMFPGTQTEPCCQLCGKAPVKNLFLIKNDSKKWLMSVGSECVAHFEEGKSGQELSRESKVKEAVEADNMMQNIKKMIVQNYSFQSHEGYGRYVKNWRKSTIPNNLLTEVKIFADSNSGTDVINWEYVYKLIPTFGYEYLVQNKFYGNSEQAEEKKLLSWYSRNKEKIHAILSAWKQLHQDN